jgi:bacillolysin
MKSSKGACALLALFAFASADARATAAPQQTVENAVAALSAAAGAPVRTLSSPSTGFIRFLDATSGPGVLVRSAARPTAEGRALAFLSTYGRAFGLDGRSALRVVGTLHDDVGMDHVRLQQTYRGVPVTAGELMIHLKQDRVTAASAIVLPVAGELDTTPRIDAPQAGDAAAQFLRRKLHVDTAPPAKAPRLEVFNRGLLEQHSLPTRLAWFVEAADASHHEFVWIDAQTGTALLHFAQRPEARVRSVYDGRNIDQLPGKLMRKEGDADTGDKDADLAYRYSGDTYDYYKTQHNRDSFDDKGGELISTVHFCPFNGECDFQNAFWNGTQMVYGNGFSGADDVVAHELTHAVTEHSAGLFYYMQSGALNESYSDIFGETIDLTNHAGVDTPRVRWLIGEEVPVFGPFRDMKNPNRFYQPGKSSDPELFCGGNIDAGGVHYNSGIPNHAYQLMVDGGSYNGRTLRGIGLQKAAAIEYRTLTHYLISASNFSDNDAALRTACSDLIGTAGITASDCAQVGRALEAVEMGMLFPCNGGAHRPTPPLCPSGQSARTLLLDDMENVGSGNWTSSVAVGANNWTGPGGGEGDEGLYWTYFATSGKHSLWGSYPGAFGNQSVASDASVSMSHDLALPAAARVQFRHSYGFTWGADDGYGAPRQANPTLYLDGGVVEYSTDGGGTWSDGGGLIAAGARYGGISHDGLGEDAITATFLTFSGVTTSDNPLAGRKAFLGESKGYTASQLDLSSLGGQNVRLRFRMGTKNLFDGDENGWDYGWFIDDVRFYTCGPTPTLSVDGITVPEGDTGTTPATFNVTLSAPSDGEVSVHYATADGSARAGKDYDAQSGTLVFAPGITSLPVAVPVRGNTLATPQRFFLLRLSQPVGAPLVRGDARATLIDEETPAAQLLSPAPGALLADSATFTWTAGGNVTEYWLAIGRRPGGRDVYDKSQGKSLSVTVAGLPTDGNPLYVRLRSRMGAAWRVFDYLYAATPGTSTLATLVSPKPGSTLAETTSATFTWTAGRNVTAYRLSIGTTAGGMEIYDGNEETSLSRVVTGLPTEGTPLYVRLSSLTPIGWQSNDYTVGTAITPPEPARLAFEVPPLHSGWTDFGWTQGRAVKEYRLSIGSTPGGTDVYDALQGTAHRLTIVDLPTDGRMLYLRLWSNTRDGWLYKDYQARAATATPAVFHIVSPVPGSTLDAQPVFTWNAIANASRYELGVTDTPDVYSFPRTVCYGTEETQCPYENAPTDGRSLFVRGVGLDSSYFEFRDTASLYLYTAATVEPVAAPHLTNPKPGSMVASDNVTFEWAGSVAGDELEYWLAVGFGPSGRELYNAAQGLNRSVTVSGLPTNGRPVFIDLRWRDAQGWHHTVYHYFTPPVLSVNDVSVAEGDTGSHTAAITVSTASLPWTPIGVDFATTGGNAVPGLDYTPVAGTLTLSHGAVEAQVGIAINGNTRDDGDRKITLSLGDPQNAVLGKGQADLTIVDDDVAGTIQFSAATYSAQEPATAILLVPVKLTRTGGAASGARVFYAVYGGTATDDKDFFNDIYFLDFDAGETSKILNVAIYSDNLREGPETVILELSNPQGGAVLGPRKKSTLTIIDRPPTHAATVADPSGSDTSKAAPETTPSSVPSGTP